MRRLSYILIIAMLASACSGAATPTTPSTPVRWDLEAQGVPRFVAHDYIDLTNIMRISRFRSGEGHDYSDDVERCRSMKHYFVPRFTSIDSSTIPVSAPVTGTVERVRQEWAGLQLEIQAADYPAFRIILFQDSKGLARAGPFSLGASVDRVVRRPSAATGSTAKARARPISAKSRGYSSWKSPRQTSSGKSMWL